MTPDDYNEVIDKILKMMKIIIDHNLYKKKMMNNTIIISLFIFTFINFIIIYYFYRKLNKKIEKVGSTNFFERERDNQNKNY